MYNIEKETSHDIQKTLKDTVDVQIQRCSRPLYKMVYVYITNAYISIYLKSSLYYL